MKANLLSFALILCVPAARLLAAPAPAQDDADISDEQFVSQMARGKRGPAAPDVEASPVSISPALDANCMKAVKAQGWIKDQGMIDGSCNSIRDADGAAAVPECHRLLHADKEDPQYYAASCRLALDKKAAQGIAECHRKLKESGAEPGALAVSCAQVQDDDGAAAVLDLRKSLLASGVDAAALPMAASAVRNKGDADAVALCFSKLGAAGDGADSRARSCRNVRDVGAVDAVVSCHMKLTAAGVDPAFHARACQSVKDAAAVEAVVACHKELTAAGIDPNYHARACQGVKDAQAAHGMAACLQKSAAGRGIESSKFVFLLRTCRQATGSKKAGSAVPSAPSETGAGTAAQSAGPSTASDAAGARGKMFFYSDSCSELDGWLAKQSAASPDGQFDMTKPIFIVAHHVPKIGGSVSARDLMGRSADLHVVDMTGRQIQVAGASGGMTKNVTLCTVR